MPPPSSSSVSIVQAPWLPAPNLQNQMCWGNSDGLVEIGGMVEKVPPFLNVKM